MFGWRADDGPALNANRAAFEFSSLGGGGGGGRGVSIPVFNRQTFLDLRMQSYNITLYLHTSTNINKIGLPAKRHLNGISLESQ